MRPQGFPITGSVTVAAVAVLGLSVLRADSGSPRRNPKAPEFPAAAGTHVTRADAESLLALQNAPRAPVEAELGAAGMPLPTRSSFMASWQKVSGAVGYRLDVSTDASFSTYVNGYHDLDVGNVTGRVVTGLSQGTTYYYRVVAYDATGTTSGNPIVLTATTLASSGLIIQATFDTSITARADAATIEATINQAIAIYELLFSNPITVQILFRYASTLPNGSPFPSDGLAATNFVIYQEPWNTFISNLQTDAKTENDFAANATLPTTALTANITPSSADGRAVGLNTPPSMFADGTVASGGPYDGIVTLNSARPWQFTRPTSSTNYDAQSAIEHETDEVLGLGSHLGTNQRDLRPQDLFSWSSAGTRNLTSSGTRYFSINGGTVNIVNFNQNSTGDLGDWLSTSCPQTNPYVQNAFVCSGQYSDVAGISPEGVSLDVIGYNIVNGSTTDLNNDGKLDWVLYNPATQEIALWFMNNNVLIATLSVATLPAGWQLVAAADLNRDGHPDFVVFNPSIHQTFGCYLSGDGLIALVPGPTVYGDPRFAVADFPSDGERDYVLFDPSTGQIAIHYLWWYNYGLNDDGVVFGPTIPSPWKLVGVADFNFDGHPDYLFFNPTTLQTGTLYLSGVTLIGGAYGPTLPAGWELIGTADFNGDGNPDYLLYNPSTGQTQIWYLSGVTVIGSADGPTVPAGWTVIAP